MQGRACNASSMQEGSSMQAPAVGACGPSSRGVLMRPALSGREGGSHLQD